MPILIHRRRDSRRFGNFTVVRRGGGLEFEQRTVPLLWHAPAGVPVPHSPRTGAARATGRPTDSGREATTGNINNKEPPRHVWRRIKALRLLPSTQIPFSPAHVSAVEKVIDYGQPIEVVPLPR